MQYRQQPAKFSLGKSLPCKPRQVVSREVCNKHAFVLAKRHRHRHRHRHRDKFLQVFRIHRVLVAV